MMSAPLVPSPVNCGVRRIPRTVTLLTKVPHDQASVAASDGPGQPSQCRCGGRGPRVTAGSAPNPGPPLRALQPAPAQCCPPPGFPRSLRLFLRNKSQVR